MQLKTESGIERANSTLNRIMSSLRTIDDILDLLAVSKNTSKSVLAVLSFPVEQAQQLAGSINKTILPEMFVQSILSNVSYTHQVAQDALNISQSAL